MNAMDERAAHGPGTLVATQLVVVFLVLALIAMVVVLGNAEIRWAAYAIGGLILCLGAMLFGIRRALTAYFILALSVDVHYYLTTPPPPLYIGMSAGC